MPADWLAGVVQDIAATARNALVGGPFGSNLVSRDYREFGVPVIRGQNMAGRWVGGEFAYVSEEKAHSLTANLARGGDIVFTQRGTLGQVSLVPGADDERYLISQSQMKLSVNPDLADPLFYYYVFSSPAQREHIRLSAIQTGVPHTNLGILRSTEILIPPLEEQRAVGRILGALDDKIELNHRMNETLESIAGTLFRSWFVDFDPVLARVEGRETGFPEEIARVFPDALEDTEHGEIPKGWRYRPLGELVDLKRGRTYKGNLKGLPGPVLLGLASIRRNGGFRGDNLSTYGGDSPEDLLLRPGELFASLKDVTQSADLLGAVARVPDHVEVGRLTQDTVKLVLKSEKTSRSILYRCLLTDAYRAYCRAHATGTTNLGLSRDDFLAFPIPQPPESVARLYDSINFSLDSRMALLTEESRTLAATRDLLLPKLISGELRVDPVRTHQHLPSPA